MYIKSLFILSIAAAGVLADSSSSDKSTPTTSASASHVSGVPIPVTPSGLPACTNTAAKHACPGIAIKCPSSCPDTCYISVTNACCPGGGAIVCSLSEASSAAASGITASGTAAMTGSSAGIMPTTAANATSVGASSAGASASASTSGSGSTSGSQLAYQVAGTLAAGLGLFTVAMVNL
ncbi:hypothetical protein VKS41_006000 [Umbelopsis sp. WA50703]